MDCKRSYLHLRRRRKEISEIFLNKRSKIALKKTILRDLVPNCGPFAGVGGGRIPLISPPAYAHESVEISDLVRLCRLEIVMRAAFSSDTDIQGQGDNNKYVRTTDFLAKQVLKRALTPLHHFHWLYNRTEDGKQFYKNAQYCSDVAAAVIDQRRSDMAQSDVGDNKRARKYLDFLDRLLLARDEDGNGLSRADVLNEVRTFMFGGYDTSKSGIMWLIYNLAKHPVYQDLARYECKTGARSFRILRKHLAA